MVHNLKDGGTFLLNCGWDLEGLEKNLPASMKTLSRRKTKFYTSDAISIAVTWDSKQDQYNFYRPLSF